MGEKRGGRINIRIAFNEDNQTIHGTKQIVVGNEVLRVHDVPNFQEVFNAYMRLKYGIPPSPTLSARAYHKTVTEYVPQGLGEIIDAFIEEHPERYEELTEIYHKQELEKESRILPPTEEMHRRLYVASQAYDEIVPIAKRVAPDLPLEVFTQ